MFNIVWSRLIAWLLPWFLRTQTHQDWLNSLLTPLKNVWADFLVWKDEMIYEAYMTGQVINLEMLLNDKFNGSTPAWIWNTSTFTYDPNTPSAIYIIDFANSIPVTYLWNQPEGRPSPFIYNNGETLTTPQVYLYNQSEYDDQADFVIMVPYAVADVSTDAVFVAKVKAWVNKYRQAGVRFQIVNY